MLNKKEITIIIVIVLLFLFGGAYKFLQNNDKITITSGAQPEETPALAPAKKDSNALPVDASNAPTQEEATPTEVAVYISGAVLNPDVYYLPPHSRVKDVVTMAGGFTADADKDQINLAQIVADEEHIYVRRMGEEGILPDDTQKSQASNPSKSGKVNLNTAAKEELMTLPGIGEAIAQNIIDYRESNGGFHSIEEIQQVNRIGEKTYEKLKDLIDIK